MGKVKNLEKKDKSNAEFDKKNPANRVKSINDDKLKKKSKQKNKLPSAVGGAVEKEVKKDVKQEVAKALKAKENLKKPKAVAKTDDKSKDVTKSETPVEVPDKLATRDVLKKAVKAGKEGIDKEKEAATTKNLFDDELRYGLQVIAAKIPKTPPHTKKIKLEHSLFGDQQPDVCFIIRDAKIKKSETAGDEAVMKFEEMLKENGVTGIKTVMPLSKLKKDYGPHNMKIKLLNTYDLFLVESEIAEHTYSILGKHFIQKRKRPLQVDTSRKETMNDTIENAKKKVSFKVNSASNFSIFEVGTHKMENNKIVDNIMSALEQLKEKWPGGWKNIMRLYLKPMAISKVSIPIYYSKINPNDVEVPVEVGVKQTRLDKLTDQLAKKSKKFRLDKKQKKLIYVKGPNPNAPKPADATGEGKKKKDKKRKLENDQEVKVDVVEQDDQTSKKKKKKNSESEAPAVVAKSDEPKSKKKKAEEVVEAPKKADKKNKKKLAEVPAVEVTPIETKVVKKKKDKKNKA